MDNMLYHINAQRLRPGSGASLDILNAAEARRARRFHAGFVQYAPTPLVPLPYLASTLGLGNIRAKDESKRFGLNAFKVLGASYAMGRYLAERLGKSIDDLTPADLCSPAVSERLGPITFVSATDGNHGRAVAWTAQQLGKKAVIYMPKGSDPARLRISAATARKPASRISITTTVRLAWKMACENGWIMVQDTAWDGYEDIPTWIIKAMPRLPWRRWPSGAPKAEPPTHLFLQAGVGSFASGVLGYMASELGDALPKTIIVEPHAADCIYRSALAGDGQPHNVTGDLSTLMAGLACGEPCTVGWPILRDYASAYVSCPDYVAANGMRLYAAARGGDAPIVSGESGAAPLGALDHIMRNPALAPLRESLGLGPDSRVMLISTEGDTSPRVWRDVCWYGRHGDELRVGE
ncbi:MAG: diaminopropionate ammonia-lyase [Bilophila wadsworthia]